MELRLAPSAIADIGAIIDYVSMESPAVAAAISRRFGEVYLRILEFPNIGRATSRKGMRYVNTAPYPYLIFYRPSKSIVEIVAVRHGARSPRSMPARPR